MYFVVFMLLFNGSSIDKLHVNRHQVYIRRESGFGLYKKLKVINRLWTIYRTSYFSYKNHFVHFKL